MFVKFPRTPHLAFTGNENQIGDDIILTEDDYHPLAHKEVVIQEKTDGNCIGFSFDENADLQAQHRGDYLRTKGSEWRFVEGWMNLNYDNLIEACELNKNVVFGEWSFWKHTVPYDALPSYFIVHDIFDKDKKRFLPTSKVDEIAKNANLIPTPTIYTGKTPTRKDLIKMSQRQSQFSKKEQYAEGIYIRVEDDEKNMDRMKIVSPEFYKNFNPNIHWREYLKEANHSTNPFEKYWRESTSKKH